MPVLGVHQRPWASELACFRASNARQRQPASVGVVTVADTVSNPTVSPRHLVSRHHSLYDIDIKVVLSGTVDGFPLCPPMALQQEAPMRPVIPKLLILFSVLLLATTSAASQELQTPDGTWIGFAQAGDWEVFLELLMVDEPDPSVKVVRMWPGRPGAETGIEISDSGIRFELEFSIGMVRFDGHQEGSAINGTLELDESLGRFSIRRMIDFAPLDFQPYEGSYELEDGRTVYVRRHDNVQQSPPFPVTGGSYFLFDDSGRYRRLYPIAPNRFVAAEKLSDSGPFFSELEFVRETDDDAGGLRWQLNGQPALSGTRKTVYRQEDVTIVGESVRLEGRLLVPSAPGPHPAVVLLHGLGAFSRNMAGPFLIADYLASRGVAVLEYDKRGVGGSTGGHPFNDRVSEYASDAVHATEYLSLRPDIDPDRIGLLGVSAGAGVAAVAGGQSEKISFLVLVSGRGVSFAEAWPPDEVVGNLESQLRARGFEEEAVQDAIRVAELDLAYSLRGERWEELEDAITKYRDAPWFATTWMGWTGATTRDHKYWSRYSQPVEDDPQLALRALRVPILAIWGELDRTFPPQVHKPGLANLLAETGHPDYKLVEFSNTGHGMNEIPPGKPLRGRGIAEGYFETVGGWLDKRLEVNQDKR